MVRSIFLLLFGSLSLCVQSQSVQTLSGARYGAMANSRGADISVWQGLSNPAGILTREEGWQVGVGYTNRFGLSELGSSDLVASFPVSKGRFGLVVHSFGYSSFRQNQFSGTYAMKLSDRLRTGIQLNYFSVNIAEGYGRFSAVTANLGLQYDFNDKVTLGIWIKNPNRSRISSEVKEYVQSVISAGLKYRIADNLLVLSDLSKDLDVDPNFSFGLEYQPVNEWFLRAGMSTLNKGLAFGFGYSPNKWSIDLASTYHQVLGFSPMLSFTYRNE